MQQLPRSQHTPNKPSCLPSTTDANVFIPTISERRLSTYSCRFLLRYSFAACLAHRTVHLTLVHKCMHSVSPHAARLVPVKVTHQKAGVFRPRLLGMTGPVGRASTEEKLPALIAFDLDGTLWCVTMELPVALGLRVTLNLDCRQVLCSGRGTHA